MKEQTYSIENVESFEPVHIFECGQCFRWNQEKDGSYTGVVGNNILNVRKQRKHIIIHGYCQEEIEMLCKQYFDLNTNYEAIKTKLSSIDAYLQTSIQYGKGIRILKQDPWETLISFIISANNNIPRIKKIIEALCKKYGKEIEWKNRKYYTFPTPEELFDASVKDLRTLGLGFRDVRVFETTRLIANKKVNLKKLQTIQQTSDLKEKLLQFPGVGPKVADCIMLFSMKKIEVFPIDVWIKRVMVELYFQNNQDVNKIYPTNQQILEFAQNKFGKLAGIAQQYLFYWRREIDKEEIKRV